MFEVRQNGRGNDPYTIAIVMNAAIEVPKGSGHFMRDPINDVVHIVRRSIEEQIIPLLRGEYQGVTERPLCDFADSVRIATYLDRLPVSEETTLISEWTGSRRILEPRRDFIADFLKRNSLWADVVFVVSASASSAGLISSSAWPTTDDDQKAGVTFRYDNREAR